MRVFMTTDAIGGMWSYTADLSAGLLDRGVDVVVAILGLSPRPDQMADLPLGAAVIETGLPLDWLAGDERALVAAGRTLAAAAHDVQADLIHLNSPSYAAGVSYGMPVLGVCHSCLATWWQAVRAEPLPPSVKWKVDRVAAGYAACDVLLAPSESFARATADCYGRLPTTVLNGRSTARHRPAVKEAFVLTSGRLWDAGKDIRALDRAAAFMQGEVQAAGPLRGPDGVTVQLRTITSLGRLDASAMAEFLDRALVFTSLAAYEPFGLSVLEAAQAGCALVLSDIPTFRELWSDVAVFVDPTQPRDVAAALDGLLNDAPRALRMGQRAAARADRYSVDAMVDGTLATYRTLCPALPRQVRVPA